MAGAGGLPQLAALRLPAIATTAHILALLASARAMKDPRKSTEFDRIAPLGPKRGQNRPVIDIADEQICTRSWVIVGCGYTGTRLARRLLERGAQVWATRRNPQAAEALAAQLDPLRHRDSQSDHRGRLRTYALDLEHLGALQGENVGESGALDWLPAGAIVVDSAPPGTAEPAGRQEIALVAALARASASRVVYIGSTGVYPRGDGSWVTEDTPPAPASNRGQRRLAAESALLEAAAEHDIAAVSLRASGIYGPGRGVHARLHAGTYRIIGPGDTWVNRIHVDDLVSVVIAAAMIPALPSLIYNVADNRPESSRVHADAVADRLGVPRPPSVPVSQVEPWIAAMLGANRRISNARMVRELGVELAYPTWREGLAQCLAEDGIETPQSGAGRP